MKELRCIVFSDKELLQAVLERRRKLNEPMPGGAVTGLHLEMAANSLRTIVQFDGGKSSLQVPEAEVQAALLAYCMAKNIPLPVDAEKSLHLIKGRATLIITMNFQKGGRLVANG